MNDLIKFQQERIEALLAENAKLREQLTEAKEILTDLVNDLQVIDAEILHFPNLYEPTKAFDEAFNNPIDQLNNLLG